MVSLPSFCEDAEKGGLGATEPTDTAPARLSEGDADAKIVTPFLRFRGRHGFGRDHASHRLPPLGSPSAASAGRPSGSRSRRSGPSRSGFGRTRWTSRTRFRSSSRSPLRAQCFDGFEKAVGEKSAAFLIGRVPRPGAPGRCPAPTRETSRRTCGILPKRRKAANNR